MLCEEVLPHRVVTLEEAAAFMITFDYHVTAPLVDEKVL